MGDKDVNFGTEIDHEYTYTLCMKYCLQVNINKCVDAANILGFNPQIYRRWNMHSENKTAVIVTDLCNMTY
jgi:hypothetical protein